MQKINPKKISIAEECEIPDAKGSSKVKYKNGYHQ